jgi:hypothetical protein
MDQLKLGTEEQVVESFVVKESNGKVDSGHYLKYTKNKKL